MAYDELVAELTEERQRLDALLDEALGQFALYEENLNARMKTATPAAMAELMAERSRMEDELGIADLVERIDQFRERIAALRR